MNFLKIGSSPVVEIPLAVKFENMYLNQCYQILPGSTEFDESWSNVVSVDDIVKDIRESIAVFKDVRSEIKTAVELGHQTEIENSIEKLHKMSEEFGSLFGTPASITNSFQAKIEAVTEVFSCAIGTPSGNLRTSSNCSFSDAENLLDELICELEFLNFYTVANSSSGTLVSPSGTESEIIYYTPAGIAVSLPRRAKPYFGLTAKNPTTGADVAIQVASSALMGFELDGTFYGAHFRMEGEWYFLGYMGPNRAYEFSSYYNNIFENGQLKYDINLGFQNAPFIKGLSREVLEKATGKVLENGVKSVKPLIPLRAINIGCIASLPLIVLGDSPDKKFGQGTVNINLPEAKAFDASPLPSTAILVKTNLCEEVLPVSRTGENCSVYVIWGPNFDKNFPEERYGKMDVAKYGMTCASPAGGRPQKQVDKFNADYSALIVANGNMKFGWSWVKQGISKKECHFLEKALTAAYVINNGGRLPWKHKLPSFVNDPEVKEDQTTEFDENITLTERTNRAKKWQKEVNCKN